MNSKLLFVIVFVGGLTLGGLSQSGSTSKQAAQTWDTEEAAITTMVAFQNRLDNLEKSQTPDSVDALSKQIDAQLGIQDILIKYRQSQQAKYAPFVPTAGTVIVGLLTCVVTWTVAKRSKRVAQA